MSGWVQALGSILAIIAAIFIASSQARREQASKRQDQRVMVLIVLDIARRTCSQIGKAKKAAIRPRAYEAITGKDNQEVEAIERLYLELQGIDLTAIGSANIVTAVIRLRGAFNELLAQVRGDGSISLASLAVSDHLLTMPARTAVTDAAMKLMDACANPWAD